jgi:hypothetical protein
MDFKALKMTEPPKGSLIYLFKEKIKEIKSPDLYNFRDILVRYQTEFISLGK